MIIRTIQTYNISVWEIDQIAYYKIKNYSNISKYNDIKVYVRKFLSRFKIKIEKKWGYTSSRQYH